MKAIPKFTTRTSAVAYLVQIGFPQNFAKAAVDQAFNYEPNGDTRDALWAQADPEDPNSDFIPTEVDLSELVINYNTMASMMDVKNDIIMFDGEPVYDINGDPLHGKLTTMSPEGIVILDLKGLHDVLESGNLGVDTIEGRMLPYCFDLKTEGMVEQKGAVQIMNRLNDILTEFNNLCGEFHDLYDGEFC